ncbi:MAG TPA: penicillin-binding protein 2 [Alphaproteobacteria bacterium]|nr:penicillin-binding protein 2 [Alphaproteobacteria bacterium]
MLPGGRDNKQIKQFTRRAALLGGAQALMFGVVASRIYFLQVIESEQYKVLADENRISLRLLLPQRGRILDRYGADLATLRQNYGVILIPERTRDIHQTLNTLGEYIPITEQDRARVLREIRAKRSFMPIIVAENLSWEDFARINVKSYDLAGVQPIVGETRAYPYGPLLSHLIGYVASVSEKDLEAIENPEPVLRSPGFRIGKSGIEKMLDTELRGRAGNMRVEVNAYDRVIRELTRTEGVTGKDIVLSIDIEMQKAAAAALTGQSGSIVCLDIERGEVLTLVSVPGYEPDAFNMGLSNAQWRALQNDPMHPLINKSIAGLYPPGSTIKPLIALAALSTGAMSPSDGVFCNGRFRLGNHLFHCWKKEGHGAMTMREAIKHSCDVYFYETGRRTGIMPMHDMGVQFGLGVKYDIGLPDEKQGVMPSPDWKRKRFGQPWVGGETLIAAIGQGYMQTTPMQLAVMTARIASGRLVMPRLVRDVSAEAKPIIFPHLNVPDEHLKIAQDGMWAVVNEVRGTAYARRMEGNGYQYSGKTGTAQVRRISREERYRKGGVTKNENLPWEQRDHALFVGYAPSDTPRYAISVVIEHGGGGSLVAAPIARDILSLALARESHGLKLYTPDTQTS